MAFLGREGKYADVPRPDLVLLDLNLLLFYLCRRVKM